MAISRLSALIAGLTFAAASGLAQPMVLMRSSSMVTSKMQVQVSQAPEQIRLALTGDPTQMGIYWVTSNKTNDDYAATVQYGPTPAKLDLSAAGNNNNYTAFKIKSPSLHWAVMTELAPATVYYYRVGDPQYGWSALYNFTAAPVVGAVSAYPVTFLSYGDMGVSNSQHTANLTAQLLSQGEANLIVHAGDISYADDRASINNGSIYEGILNDFYNEVQQSTSIAPYMMSSGNHESILDFLAYRMRVAPTMPTAQSGSASPFWYSFNYGPVHFMAFDQDQDWQVGSEQYTWILSDLKAVDRTVTPWVVAFNHFPLLCSNKFWCWDGSGTRQRFMSVYDPIFNAPATKVDVFIAGHVHAAEILYPSFNGTVVQQDFNDVNNTLQVMVGFPGDIEVCCNDWLKPQPSYSFWRDDDVASDGGFFGFSQFTIQNGTHLRLRVWDAVNQTVVQDLWVSRATATATLAAADAPAADRLEFP